MKRILSIIYFLSLCLAASAYSVSEKEALAAAEKYFGLSRGSDKISLVMSGVQQGTRALADAPEFYVFNRKDGGYVIISGENSIRPVLGYSDTGSFPNYSQLPENIRWWMDCLAASVSGNRKENIVPDEVILKQWDDIGKTKTRGSYSTVCLNTVQWTQNDPFNVLMPEINGNRCVSGCVPTAIAEIMCYYGWPEKASGRVESYDVRYNIGGTIVTRTYGGYDLGTEYNWTAMQSAVNEEEAGKLTDSEKQNMSQLIKDVGMCIQAIYSPSETSAVTEYFYQRICSPFGYNLNAVTEKRRYYSATEWENILKSEIDEGRPILYDGGKLTDELNQSGHCFVVDGYDTDNNFHINFGWGEWANGYFWIGESYYGGQSAYLKFMPSHLAPPSSMEGKLALVNAYLNNCYSFIPSESTLTAGQNFSMQIYYLTSLNGTYDGLMKLVRENKDGEVQEDVSSTLEVSIQSGQGKTYTFYNCCFHQLKFGDRLALYANRGPDTDFERVAVCQNGEGVKYFPLTPYAFIDTKESYSVGEQFMLGLKNNNFPYLWDRGVLSYFTEWAFYCDGVLEDTLSDYGARFYEIPKAGNWMVKATVREISTKKVSTILCAQFAAE